jgi:hypothetical protein
MLSVLASNPDAVSPGIDEVRITIIPSNNPFPGPFGLDLPEGAMFGVRFQVKTDAPLGGLNIPTNFEFAFGDPAGLDETLEIPVLGSVAVTANIVAIPEAETWAMMLAGLALVGAAANRARRQA